MNQSTYLSILARAPADEVKQFAEALLPELGAVTVLHNRTGLAMLPMNEPVADAAFYLGEVLLTEAHVQLDRAEGYAACLGRDLEQALAIALLDAAVTANIARAQITAFVAAHGQALDAAEQDLLHQVERTRVEMETF